MNMDIIFDISEIKIKMKIFFAKIFQRGEHDLSRKNTTFSKSPLVQALWEALYKSWNHQFEKRGWIQAYDVLASLKNFREKYFHFYFYVRNVKNNIYAHLLIPG